MLIQGTHLGNKITTQDGVFETSHNALNEYTGIFNITNIRCEDVEKVVEVEGRTIKVFLNSLKVDVVEIFKSEFKQVTVAKDKEDRQLPIKKSVAKDYKTQSEDVEQVQSNIELIPSEVEEIINNSPEPSVLDRVVQNVNEHERLFGKSLCQLDEFQIDSSADRATIARQATLLNVNGFTFNASTQTYIKRKVA